jgi:hypothetical protein
LFIFGVGGNMQNTRLRLLILFLLTVSLMSCTDNSSIGESYEYKKEEVNAYNDILNDIVDTTRYAIEEKVVIFFLFDSLTGIDNRSTGEYEPDNEYLKLKVRRRSIRPGEITAISKYKFIRATRYPKDSIAGTTIHTIIQDTIKINKDEFFTRRWLTFSRVCFNKDFEKGFLYYVSWCGNLCSHSVRLDIQKVNGRWTVKTRRKGPVS